MCYIFSSGISVQEYEDEADEEDPGTTVEAVGAVPDEGHLDERSVGCMCIYVWTRLVCVCDSSYDIVLLDTIGIIGINTLPHKL